MANNFQHKPGLLSPTFNDNPLQAASEAGIKSGVTSGERVLSIDEFCRRYGPSRAMAYRLLREGNLRGKKLGRSTYIPVDSAEAWLAALPDYTSR